MATKAARAVRVWRAPALVAGALLMVAAPANAAAIAEPASQTAGATSTLQAPTMQPVECIGQELVLSWTDVPGASFYRIFADGVWVAGTSGTIYNLYGWDRDITFTVRAVDESGNISPESNGVKSPCQEAG